MSVILFIIVPIIIIIFLTLIYPTDKVEFKKFSKKEEDQLLSEEIKSLEKLIHKSDTLRNETLNKIKTNNKTKNSKKSINTNNIVQKVLKNGFIVQPVLYFDDENEQYVIL
jgi:Tfp pilus assembly protein PilE